MDVRTAIQITLRWWWLLVLGPLVGGMVAYFYTSRLTPTYEAKATLLVRQSQNPAVPTVPEFTISFYLNRTYKDLVSTETVLSQVIQNLDLPYGVNTLRSKVSASARSDSLLLVLRVRDASPAMAQRIANETAEVFTNEIRTSQLADIARLQSSLAAAGFENSQQLVTAQVAALGSITLVERASLPSSPISPRVTYNTIIGIILGLALAVGLVLLLEYLDDTVKSPEEVQRFSGLNTLAAVMRMQVDKANRVATTSHSQLAEVYRMLRTNIQFSFAGKPGKTILVTSATPREGKTTTVANLSVAMAQMGKKVIAVDTDLRRSDLHTFFKVPNQKGLSELLITDGALVIDYLQPSGIDNLSILTSGAHPPNPSELLTSPRMTAVVQQLKDRADVVLFDSPPVLVAADSSVLASAVDGVLVVAECGKTRTHTFKAGVQQLADAKANILGTVLNKVKRRGAGGYYYYGYYYYHYGYKYGYKYQSDGRKEGAAKGKIRERRRVPAQKVEKGDKDKGTA